MIDPDVAYRFALSMVTLLSIAVLSLPIFLIGLLKWWEARRLRARMRNRRTQSPIMLPHEGED